MKTDKLDRVFSKLVRARADWTCEACGKRYERNSQGLHCSHFWSRRNRATRWSGLNAAAHCYACHQRLGGNPVEFNRWIERHLGEGGARILEDKARSIAKYSSYDIEDIYQHLKQELETMLARRDAGEAGRIEFEEAQ